MTLKCHLFGDDLYSKRSEKIWQILKLLSLNGELYQCEMDKKTGGSYRNLIRQLKLLERAGLIRIARKEPSSKRGKEKHVWELTFSGLMSIFASDSVLMLAGDGELDQIADSYKDKWLIFQEWKNLCKDREIRSIVINSISLFASKNVTPKFRRMKQLKRDADLMGGSTALRAFQRARERFLERDATLAALMLDIVFSHGAVPPWIYEPRNENAELVRLWKTAVENANIRSFIEEQFKYEDYKHRIVTQFQDWFLGGKVPKDLKPKPPFSAKRKH
jgi:DNA-binding transcriptional ArsR family regulator